MINWFSQYYLQILVNKQVAVHNPSGAWTIETLKILTLLLISLLIVRSAVQSLYFHRLKKSFMPYSVREHAHFLKMYRQSAKDVGLREIPPLRKFIDSRPLIFTAGIFNPAVFIAPELLKQLSEDELNAAVVHELQHIKRRDSLWLLTIDLLTALLPAFVLIGCAYKLAFYPQEAVYIFIAAVLIVPLFRYCVGRRFVNMREAVCDDRTLVLVPDPLVLASALVKVWKIGANLPRYRMRLALSAARPFSESHGGVESRIRRLTNYRRSSAGRVFRKVIAVSFACCIVFFGSVFWMLERNFRNIHVSVLDKSISVNINMREKFGHAARYDLKMMPELVSEEKMQTIPGIDRVIKVKELHIRHEKEPSTTFLEVTLNKKDAEPDITR